MHINSLPNECLLELFGFISLTDLLLHLSLVCTRWAALVPGHCKRKRSVVITNQRIVGQIPQKDILCNAGRHAGERGHHLNLPNLIDPHVISTIRMLLPNIRKVTFYIDLVPKKLIPMLLLWRANLHCLKFIIKANPAIEVSCTRLTTYSEHLRYSNKVKWPQVAVP